MEFLNDRYASLDVSWNMQGKLFNRIPLIKKLKWKWVNDYALPVCMVIGMAVAIPLTSWLGGAI